LRFLKLCNKLAFVVPSRLLAQEAWPKITELPMNRRCDGDSG
jgi:hypothetical protein